MLGGGGAHVWEKAKRMAVWGFIINAIIKYLTLRATSLVKSKIIKILNDTFKTLSEEISSTYPGHNKKRL